MCPSSPARGWYRSLLPGLFRTPFCLDQASCGHDRGFRQIHRSLYPAEALELVRFQKGQRKDRVLQHKLRAFKKDEGVVFVGVAQEKVRVPRTTRKRLESGGTIERLRGSFSPPPW